MDDTESEREREGWEAVDELEESWVFDNAGLELEIQVLRKGGKYRLFVSQPMSLTKDTFVELPSAPRKKLSSLGDIPHREYVEILGVGGYGGPDLGKILLKLGIKQKLSAYGHEGMETFERSNIS